MFVDSTVRDSSDAVRREFSFHDVVALTAALMAKKKRDRLKVHKEARRLARLGLGMPPTERAIPDKRGKPAKHKKKFPDAETE